MTTFGICSADNVNVETVGQFSGDVFNVFVAGNHAYLGQGQDLVILDISDITSLSEVGRVATMSEVYSVDISGSYACVANGDAGITIVDVSNPASPAILGSYDTDGFARDIAISGNYACVADVSSLLIVDISVPSSPTPAGTYDTIGFANGVIVSGDYAYVSDDSKGIFDGSSGLVILDISNPSSPGFVGTYDAIYAYSTAVSGNYAYVADDSGLSILDVSDPSSPAPAGRYPSDGDSNGVAVSGNYVYVADGSGVFIVDVSDPSAPVYMGSYDGSYGRDVAVSGNYAYVADSNNGLVVIALTSHSSPGGPSGDSADNTTTEDEADKHPVILEIGDKSINVNELLTFSVSATDEDGDIIMYSASDLPEGAILDANTGIFSWTPETEGSYTVTFTAESNGLTASETITIDVSSSGSVTPDSSGPQISDLAGEVSSSSITLTWMNSPDVVSVELSRDDLFIDNVTGTATTYEDDGLDSDTSYVYSLLPYLSDGSTGAVETIALSTSPSSSSDDNDGIGGSDGRSSGRSSAQSSSSGGGGAGSGEAFENVAMRDAATVYLMMDSNASYEFVRQGNPVQTVSFYSLKNSGEVTSTIEVLHNRSNFVSSDVEGLVYKYVNVWVGKSGFATETNIKDPVVQFRVNNSWIEETGVSPENIRLQRYDGGAWEVLPTVLEANTTNYVIFKAQTPGFSPFAITADADLEVPVNTDTKLQSADSEILSEPVLNKSADYTQTQPEKSNFWAPVIAVIVIGFFAAGYMYLKKK